MRKQLKEELWGFYLVYGFYFSVIHLWAPLAETLNRPFLDVSRNASVFCDFFYKSFATTLQLAAVFFLRSLEAMYPYLSRRNSGLEGDICDARAVSKGDDRSTF